MRRTRLHAFTYYGLRVLQVASIIVSATVGLSFRPVTNWPQWAQDAATFGKSLAWTLPICAVGIAVADRICAYLKSPQTWSTIHDFLDNLQRHFFKNVQDPQHYHRVTLFKKTTWSWDFHKWRLFGQKRWPWSGWLIPVMRSGYTMQRSRTIFWASGDDPGSAEGIPGRTWATNRVLIINSLPDLHSNPSAANIQNYATASAVSEEWLQRRLRENKPCARSLCGIPVEVNNKFWGVIVIDSKSDTLPDSADLQETYRLFGQLLGTTLKGG